MTLGFTSSSRASSLMRILLIHKTPEGNARCSRDCALNLSQNIALARPHRAFPGGGGRSGAQTNPASLGGGGRRLPQPTVREPAAAAETGGGSDPGLPPQPGGPVSGVALTGAVS